MSLQYSPVVPLEMTAPQMPMQNMPFAPVPMMMNFPNFTPQQTFPQYQPSQMTPSTDINQMPPFDPNQQFQFQQVNQMQQVQQMHQAQQFNQMPQMNTAQVDKMYVPCASPCVNQSFYFPQFSTPVSIPTAFPVATTPLYSTTSSVSPASGANASTPSTSSRSVSPVSDSCSSTEAAVTRERIEVAATKRPKVATRPFKFRSKQQKIEKIRGILKLNFESKGLWADEGELVRGPDTLRVHVKTFNGLNDVQTALKEVEESCQIVRAACPFSKKNGTQKKGFILYLKVHIDDVKRAKAIMTKYKATLKECALAIPKIERERLAQAEREAEERKKQMSTQCVNQMNGCMNTNNPAFQTQQMQTPMYTNQFANCNFNPQVLALFRQMQL